MNPDWSIDVGDADFEREVLERSHQTPVVADFWAPWCGPCRQLAPVLERAIEAHQGAVVLARINTDEAVAIAQALKVQGIPLVIGFRDGQPLAQFTGLQPDAVVEDLIGQILPTVADQLTDEADRLAAAGESAAAQEQYERALETEPTHGRALLGRARLCVAQGELDEALALLARSVPEDALARDYERMRAEIRTATAHAPADLAALRQRAAAGSDAQALELGRALVGAGQHEEALQVLLEVVRVSSEEPRETVRQLMLDVFALREPGDELTTRFRRDLGRVLFS